MKRYHLYFLFALGAAVLLIWRAVFALEATSGRLLLTVFGIGQGDAILIESTDGKQILIDGGPGETVLSELAEIMPFWDRSIDAVILTHPHADHISGLVAVLRRYDVGLILEAGAEYGSGEYAAWREVVDEEHARIILAHSPMRLDLGDVTIDILSPLDDVGTITDEHIHDAMVIAKLTHGNATALLTGDAERALEYAVIQSGTDINIDLLKVGHHGSRTSTSELLLDATSPETAVISAGEGNRYGHPHPEIIERILQRGIKLFRTDRDGTIRFISDGERFIRE
jgi:competence protein ComEC